MGNIVDRLVGYFNPANGLRRHFLREQLVRAYEGASKRDGWSPKRPGASANTDHAADAATLRIRARALVQNVPYMAQGLRSLVANVVGTGITPNWTGTDAKRLNDAFAAWVPQADADGRLDYYGIQCAAYRAMEQDGEVLIRLRPRRLSDGLAVPLQIQLLEIDWLDSYRTMRSERSGNAIVNGIEYDMLGRVVGYWLFDQHPGEMRTTMRGRSSSSFVSAENIIHLFTPERPGQGRGFTRMAPVIARVRDLQVYEDAEQQRKNLEARLSVLASGDVAKMAASPPEGEGSADVTGTNELGGFSGGQIIQLPTGMNMQVIEPKAAPGYVDYVRYQLHLIAAGFGVTYEMMTGDVSQVNFSSARVRMLDFRRECEVTQWTLLVPRLCDRICRAFADAAVLASIVQQPRYTVEHSTPKWDYVNPEQDVKADLAEVSGGMSSISEKLRRRGYKPEVVFAEIRDDFDKLRKYGVLDIMMKLQKAGAHGEETPAPPPPPPAPPPEPPKRDGGEEVIRRLLEDHTRVLSGMSPTINISTPPVEVRAGDTHVNLPEGAVQVHHRSETPVTVNVPEQQAPVVNVEVRAEASPTPVHIDNHVDVPPAQVTALIPARRTETEIHRDRTTGAIVGTTQIDKPA